MLVLHRAKLLASNQSVLALGVAPSGVRAAAPHSAPARTPGVYAQRLCTMQSQPSIHSLSPGERGLGIGIINQKFISKTDFFYKLYPRLLMQSGVNIKCDDYLYLPFWIFFINCRCDISPVLTFQESSCSSFQLL